MSSKTLNTRIINKHDIESNWKKAENFIPKQGELIIYDNKYIDEMGNEVVVADTVKYKLGDGSTNVIDLPFIDPISILNIKNNTAYLDAGSIV